MVFFGFFGPWRIKYSSPIPAILTALVQSQIPINVVWDGDLACFLSQFLNIDDLAIP